MSPRRSRNKFSFNHKDVIRAASLKGTKKSIADAAVKAFFRSILQRNRAGSNPEDFRDK